MVPCIYVLLPCKEASSYELIFKLIKTCAAKQNLCFNPNTFQIDFENAVIKAIHKEFPNSNIKGCYFHYTQAIYRKVKSNSLTGPSYKGNVKKIIRLMMALPLINLMDIGHAVVKLYA